MDYNYVSIGYDCSPASTLKALDLRKYSLPFDWVQSDTEPLIKCIDDDFNLFHKGLKLITNDRRVEDYYGLEFPHDYPTTEMQSYTVQKNVFFAEHKICDDYSKYTDDVLAKYKRRIDRFQNIMNDKTKPIIILFRSLYFGTPYPQIEQAFYIKHFLEKKYSQSNNIVFVIATNLKSSHLDIVACNPERNGKWNEKEIWNEGIIEAQQFHKSLKMIPKPKNKYIKMGLVRF